MLEREWGGEIKASRSSESPNHLQNEQRYSTRQSHNLFGISKAEEAISRSLYAAHYIGKSANGSQNILQLKNMRTEVFED